MKTPREEEDGGGASATTIAAADSSTGTDVSLRDYYLALRRADERFDDERDRRYAEVALANDRRLGEVAVEREKALKIKETADLAALSLAREIQDYKDEKANNLRTQIENERGTYATKEDLAAVVRELKVSIDPLSNFVTAQLAVQSQLSVSATRRGQLVGIAIAFLAVLVSVAIYFATH